MQILFIVVVFGEFGGEGGRTQMHFWISFVVLRLPSSLFFTWFIRVLTKGLVNRIVSLNNCPDPDVSICSGSGLKELSRQGYGTEGEYNF